MSRAWASVREWLRPESVQRQSVPPLDGGLRPNDDLDGAWTLLAGGPQDEPDDLVRLADGRWVVSQGRRLLTLDWSSEQSSRALTTAGLLAELPGPVTGIDADGADVVAAVEGHGIVRVAADGTVTTLCSDEAVRSCVTAVLVTDDRILLTVGSRHRSADEWAQALITADASGQLVGVTEGHATVLADGLPWPAGVADFDGAVAISMSLTHRIELWQVDGTRARLERELLSRLAVYPGRIRRAAEGWWVAAPHARNRLTDLLLDEPDLVRRLERDVDPASWPLPRLRAADVYRDPMQLGQLRVLGVVKPWAPPRSYGLAFLVDGQGLVSRSHHSRISGDRHGITGLATAEDGTLILVARGARRVVGLDPLTVGKEQS